GKEKAKRISYPNPTPEKSNEMDVDLPEALKGRIGEKVLEGTSTIQELPPPTIIPTTFNVPPPVISGNSLSSNALEALAAALVSLPQQIQASVGKAIAGTEGQQVKEAERGRKISKDLGRKGEKRKDRSESNRQKKKMEGEGKKGKVDSIAALIERKEKEVETDLMMAGKLQKEYMCMEKEVEVMAKRLQLLKDAAGELQRKSSCAKEELAILKKI
ncbi:Hypothetical predicted protein, partial [Paramuricea clavata]